jgi:hypothetical protein
MKAASETWGDDTQFYLKAAVRLAEEFQDWGGFGTEDDDMGYKPGDATDKLYI